MFVRKRQDGCTHINFVNHSQAISPTAALETFTRRHAETDGKRGKQDVKERRKRTKLMRVIGIMYPKELKQ